MSASPSGTPTVVLKAAQTIDPRSYLIALLGGEAGLRPGEIVALEWADVDLQRRHPGAAL